MDFDIIFGTAVVVVVLAAQIGLALWSKGTIDFIDKKNIRSAREIRRKLKKKK